MPLTVKSRITRKQALKVLDEIMDAALAEPAGARRHLRLERAGGAVSFALRAKLLTIAEHSERFDALVAAHRATVQGEKAT